MNVLIIGGTGFIGSILTDRLLRDAHEVSLLIRNKDAGPAVLQGVSFIQGDPTVRGPWQHMLRNYDAIINLAGASIFSQWTPQQKRAIRESRVSITRNIVEAIGSSPSPSVTLLSASAVGYYGFHGDEELTEESPPGNDFLATVAQEWEEGTAERGKGLPHAPWHRAGDERWRSQPNDSAVQKMCGWTHWERQTVVLVGARNGSCRCFFVSTQTSGTVRRLQCLFTQASHEQRPLKGARESPPSSLVHASPWLHGQMGDGGVWFGAPEGATRDSPAPDGVRVCVPISGDRPSACRTSRPMKEGVLKFSKTPKIVKQRRNQNEQAAIQIKAGKTPDT